MSLIRVIENTIFQADVSKTQSQSLSTNIIGNSKISDSVMEDKSSFDDIPKISRGCPGGSTFGTFTKLLSSSGVQNYQSLSRILVIGYYNKENLGDNYYQGVMGQFFPNTKLEFIGSDLLSTVKFEDYDAVIVGGGDIINNYFNNSISQFLPAGDLSPLSAEILKEFLHNFKGPKIAFSIGIPFSSVINEKYLGHFDHVFTRNYEDIREIQKILGSHRAHFIPDIALLYKPTNPNKSIMSEMSTYLESSIQSWERPSSCLRLESDNDNVNVSRGKNRRCGVFLVGNIIDYPKIVNDIGRLVSKLALTYNITLFCFHPKEDVKISEKVKELAYARLNQSTTEDIRLKILQEMARNPDRIVVDSKAYTTQEMIDNISDLDFAICMRYHSHIFCTVSGTPFMSISSTRKTRSFMKQAGLTDYQYEIELNGYGTPIGSNYETMRNVCRKAIHNRMYIAEQIRDFLKQSRFLLQNLQASRLLNVNMKDIRKGVVDFIEETGDHKNAARILSNYIIGYPDSPYIWGMSEKFKNATELSLESLDKSSSDRSNSLLDIVHESVQYLTRHGATLKNEFFNLFTTNKGDSNENFGEKSMGSLISIGEKLLPKSLPLFVDLREYQTYRGAHRGGWYVACEELYKLNSKNERGEPNGIICDMYIDRTFHWTKSYMKYRGLIPYTSPWCGFIHHTPNTTYSKYNTESLFEITEFIQSLHTCMALFSLSEPLSKYLRYKLAHIAPHIKVITFAHPVVDPSQSFSLNGYIDNPYKKLINIGSWMRNPFTIYQLKINPSIQKTVLIGKEMSDHIPPKQFKIKFISKDTSIIYSSEPIKSRSSIIENNVYLLPCRSETTFTPKWVMMLSDWLRDQGIQINHYNKDTLYIEQFNKVDNDGNKSNTIKLDQLNEKIYEMIKSVKQLEHQSDEDYDKLLTENIIFLDLIDAAAVNTIIECIVRRTPIIVNKIPGTLALLGEAYPLYYENIAEISELLKEERISNAHKYLKKLDIKRFRISFFLNQLTNVINDIN